MEVRKSVEVGMKNVNHGELKKFTKIPNEANLPVSDINNRSVEQGQKDSQALRPSDNDQKYAIEGNTINFMA